MNKLIYHNNYGFGVLLEEEGESCRCRFYNQSLIRTFRRSFIKVVNPDLVEAILNESYFSYGNSKSVKKERYIEHWTKLENLSYDSRTIRAVVRNTFDEQYVEISLKGGKAYVYCGCMFNNCDHGYQALCKLHKMFEDLLIHTDDYVLDDQLSVSYTLLRKGCVNPHGVIVQIVKRLLELDLSQFKQLLNVLKCDSQDDYLLRYIIYNEILCKRAEEIIENNPDHRYARKIVSFSKERAVFVDHLAEIEPELRLIYHIGNLEFAEAFRLLLKHRELIGKEISSETIMENLELNDSLVKEYLDSVQGIRETDSFDRGVFSVLNSEQKMLLLEDDNFLKEVSYIEIKELPGALKNKVLDRVAFDKEQADLIMNQELDGITDPLSKACILYRIYKQDPYGNGAKVKGIFKKMDCNVYLLDLLESSRYYRGRLGYVEFNEHQANRVNRKAALRYFEVSFDPYQDSVYDRVKERRVSALGCSFVVRLKSVPVLRFVLSDGYLHCDFCEFGDCGLELVNFYYRYVTQELKEQYEVACKSVLKVIESEEMAYKLEQVLSSMKQVSASVFNRQIVLNDNSKAHLEYRITDDNNGHSFYLGFKVGVDKMYVVKNVMEFLRNFRDGTVVSYGKGLQLTHTLDNFCQRDQAVLRLLVNQTLNSQYSFKNTYLITKGLLAEILEGLKGSSIEYNQVKYEVVLDKIHVDARMDSKHRLLISQDIAADQLLDCGDRLYVLDRACKRIDVLDCEREDMEFYRFALAYQGMSFKPVQKEFKEQIYSSFNHLIDIDEAVETDYKLDNLVIDAYFDYENRCISCREELRLGERWIAEDELVSPTDRMRLNNYRYYLEVLGFKDGVLDEDSQVLNFFSMDFSKLKRFCNIYLSDSIQNKKLTGFVSSKIVLTYNNNIMQAFMEKSEYSDEELARILKSIRQKKKYVLLSDDRIVDLSNEDSQEFYETVKDLGLDDKHLSEPVLLPIVNSLKALAHEKNCSVDGYLHGMIEAIAGFKDSAYELPVLEAKLRPYQEDGYRWLRTLSDYKMGGILADDMGLGKTLQVIALIASDRSECPNLIVCPKSLVFNWKNEFNRFAPDERVLEIYGDKAARDQLIGGISASAKVTYITSYDSLHRDIESYRGCFNYLIVDEAQFIKNVNALKSQSVKSIEADHKFALTGTPIENNLIDLYSIFELVLPGYFTELKEFKNNFNDNDFIAKVSKRVAPFILRRTKENVLKDLPDKYERIVTCEMTSEQRKVYDGHVMLAKQAMSANSKIFDLLPYLTRLRQICVSPATFVDGFAGESAKLSMLREIVREYVADGHKLLIFSSFVKALNLVEEVLKSEGIAYFMITGDTDGRKRIALAERFNGDCIERVGLISLKAGGTGLNLTGADTVVHLDPWWNVAAENQATDRAHRIGQQRNVEIIKLICENSIEQRVIELQNIKKDLIDRLISDDESSVMSASLDDIRFILN